MTTGLVVTFFLELALAVSVLVLMDRSRKGMRIPEIHKVPGLDAVDEAIGRATEMGRPVHFSPGIRNLDDAQTLAGMAILGHIARRCAEMGADIIATNKSTVVYPVAEAIVRQGFIEAGVPQNLKPNSVRFISEDQFAYASGVERIFRTERPAANIMVGSFWAETIIIAENGAKWGMIQIGGTANVHAIPFFVAACDYALIGEEMYAAGAYLSKDPPLVSGLVAQDWFKVLAEVLIVIGAVLQTFKNSWLNNFLNK